MRECYERTYPTPNSCLTRLFNSTVAGGRSVAYTVLVWSRLNAPVVVELSTRYTTPDTTIEIGSTSGRDRGITFKHESLTIAGVVSTAKFHILWKHCFDYVD